MKTKVLIIEGKSLSASRLEKFFSSKFEVKSIVGGSTVFSQIAEFRPEIILMDIVYQEVDGLSLVEQICGRYPEIKIIVITKYQNMESIVKSFKCGIYDYVPDSISSTKLMEMINRIVRTIRLKNKNPEQEEDDGVEEGTVIVGQSAAMCEIFKMIGKISQSRAPVAIRGETGTGKELVARVIHENSPCKNEPFITVDCTTLIETLAESILYGHEKGAFTGAFETHKGKLEIAGNGTIFFDEVSELPLSVQGKLLRFMQEKEFEMVGGKRKLRSNARIITATNRDLVPLIKQGKFRKDLYYRMKVLAIRIPPLRDRKEDIPLLIKHFSKKIKRIYGVPLLRIEDEGVKLLCEYSWPGNVRELENILVQLAIISRGEVVDQGMIKEILERSRSLISTVEKQSCYPSLEEVEKNAIYETLKYTNWNITQAAKILKISRQTLRQKMKKYRFSPPQA